MLLRKIASKKRWDKNEIPKLIPREDALFTSDAISDLRTKGNTISVWHTIDLQKENIKNILAIMALNCDKIDKVFYVALDEDVLKSKGLQIEPVAGNCESITNPEILNRHRDLVKVDYWHLGYLAEYIYELIDAGQVFSVNATEVKGYINEMISANEIDSTKLDDKKRVQLGLPALSKCFNCLDRP